MSHIALWSISLKLALFPSILGVSEEKRADAHKYLSDGSNMTQEFSADGDNWTLTTTTVMGEKSVPFTLGQELDSMTLDGRKIKVDALKENVWNMRHLK